MKAWTETHRIVGHIDMTDRIDGREYQAGFNIWSGAGEAGIAINDGRSGSAEILRFHDRVRVMMVQGLIALIRRNGYCRPRYYAPMRAAEPQVTAGRT